jgi:hypothetical protein
MSRSFILASLALLLATTLPTLGIRAGASRWVEVGVSREGIRASVDSESIKSKQGGVEVQQRFVFPPATGRRTAYVDQLAIYSCSSGLVRTLASKEFDSDGRVIRSDGEEQIPPYKVQPNTIPRYIWDVLC